MNHYIKISSYDKILLNVTLNRITNLFNLFGLTLTYIGLPTTLRKYTLLRSPHIDKKARDQYEIRNYSYLIILPIIPIHLKELLINYIINYIPAGIGLFITTFSIKKF